MNTPVSTEVAVIHGFVTLSAIGQVKALKDEPFHVRSFLVYPDAANTGTVKMGYGHGSARNIDIPKSMPAVQDKWYDLNKVTIESTAAGDVVRFEATR